MKIIPSIIIDREQHRIRVLFVVYNDDNTATIICNGKEYKETNQAFLIKDEYVAFEIPLQYFKEFKTGLLEEIEMLGWSAKQDDRELKAVKEHLQDMRTLVFQGGTKQ